MFSGIVLVFLMIFGMQIVKGKGSAFLFPATKVTETVGALAILSPNVKQVAYVCHYTQVLCIKEVGTEDSAAQIYSNYNGLGYVSWSPDGRKIVFDGYDISTEEQGAGLFVLTIATNEVCQLTDSFGVKREGSWSPDGTKIVYLFQELNQKTGQYKNPDIFVVDTSTLVVEQITKTIDISEADPSWSPDGTEIVFSANAEGTNMYQIYKKNLITEETTLLTESGLFESHPVWGELGKIAFIRFEGDTMGTNVYLYDPATRLSTPITDCKAGRCGVMTIEWGERLLITMTGDTGDGITDHYVIWEVFVS